MPKGWEKCIKQGGKIRTISGPDSKWKVPKGKYRHICFLPDGKTHRGHLKTKKNGTKRKKRSSVK